MKFITVSFLLLFSFLAMVSVAQDASSIINKSETERIEKYLSSDALAGRKTFSKEIDIAAEFIANEFKQTGLMTLNNSNTYLQKFTRFSASLISVSATMDGVKVESNKVIPISAEATLTVNEKTGYEIGNMNKGDDIRKTIGKYMSANKNYIVFVDTSFASIFSRFAQFRNNITETQKTVIFVLSATTPTQFTIEAKNKIEQRPLANVVGVIPGKKLANEYVIFSGHYDHLGIINSKNNTADSIYNGANDDAAGTTAVIMLSKYFKQLNNNERTLVFVAFTAEEVGGFGSQYFSKQFDPLAVKAMFNLEMIGTESKWGKNSAYITGYEKTNMGEILQKNLVGSVFKFYPDPYTDQNLFYRSDNATLARLGVPAHTISTSKMDSEPNYHKASDEFSTLDMDNMNEIIKAIALSSRTIVSGEDTPTRVDTKQLK
jgi:hypothetical protein